MKRKNRNRRSAGKVITAAVVGSMIGATVGLLIAPTTGEEMRRRMKSGAVGAREKLKTAAVNVESSVRELAEEVNKNVDDVKGSVSQRRKVTSPSG